MSWEQFLKMTPPGSIALDGIVKGPPNFESTTGHANFNHHDGVNRLATRSTSGQIMMALKQGLMDDFPNSSGMPTRIYINDPDQDTCLAVWLLDNYHRICGAKSEPLINKLVFAEDALDTTGGAYPFDPKSKLMRQLAWVFEDYMNARCSGTLRKMDGAGMATIVKATGKRIDDFCLGTAGETTLKTDSKSLGGGNGWKMIRELGPYAKTGLFASGTKAYVIYLGESNGRHTYSIGKMSPFVRFPIDKIFDRLNREEGIAPGAVARWDGGDLVGGSPRENGSGLDPKRVEEIVNEIVSATWH
jgi:hypothetical protein